MGLTASLISGSFRKPGSPTVEPFVFSSDELSIAVSLPQFTGTIYRPLTSPWAYTPSTTVWVSNAGNDSNPGTFASPWLTITKALATATTPGTLINVMAGTYVEPQMTMGASGTGGNPIILSCAPGALGRVFVKRTQADVVANPAAHIIYVANGVSYATINGLNLVGPVGQPYEPPLGAEVSCGILAGNPGTNIRWTNNISYLNLHCGFKGDSNITVEGCVSFSNGQRNLDHGIYLVGDNEIVKGNVVFNNAGYGIHMYHSGGGGLVFPDINRNVVWGHTNTGMAGILLACGSGSCTRNTVVGNFQGISLYTSDCHDMQINRNIFVLDVDDYDMQTSAPANPPTNITWDSNAYRNQFSYNPVFFGSNVGGVPGPNDQKAVWPAIYDPLFVNASLHDYRLQGGSPCPTFGAYAP